MIKPSTCQGCPLYTIGTGFVTKPDGKGESGVLILAEALGEEEAREGRPMVGRAGNFLNRIISRTDHPVEKRTLRRDDFWIANVVSCRPPGNELTGAPYEHEAIEHCSRYLRQTLLDLKPKAILALGNQAFRWLTGLWGIDNLRGYTFKHGEIPVVGTYHPAYIMRGKFPLTRAFRLDMLKAMSLARGVEYDIKKDYILHPTPQDMLAFCKGYSPSLPLAFDIETPYSADKDLDMGQSVEEGESYQVLRISFSYKPFSAITVPWIPPYSTMARELLAGEGDKLVWHANFDVPRLKANGVTFGGRIIDAMHEWHYLEPSLPMGLKYAATFFCPDLPAWKLVAKQEPEFYSAVDSDSLLRVHLAVRERLEKQQRWQTFERHFVELSLVLGDMSAIGVNTDPELRRLKKEELEARYGEIVRELSTLVPKEVLRRKVYKAPKERLVKEGKWEEGKMVPVWEQLSLKEELALRKREERERERERKRLERAAKKSAKVGKTGRVQAKGLAPGSLLPEAQEVPPTQGQKKRKAQRERGGAQGAEREAR